MSLRIQNNVEAFNAQRQLVGNNDKLSKAMEKLSSGYRINRAGDDAAGLAISEKLRGQIGGLGQASRNASDAISMVQTAEGALNEVHSMLQRVRELAVQYKNGTLSSNDQLSIQSEVNQLKAEITRIGTDTEFNGIKLLNGANPTISFQVGAGDAQQITVATISVAMSASRIRLSEAVRFSWYEARFAMVCSWPFWTAPNVARAAEMLLIASSICWMSVCVEDDDRAKTVETT